MDAGATLAALADDGTVATNFAVTSRGAGAMSLVIARLPSGGVPVAGCLEVGRPVWALCPVGYLGPQVERVSAAGRHAGCCLPGGW